MRLLIIVLIALSFQLNYSQKIIDSSSNAGKLPWVTGQLPSNSTTFSYKVIQGESQYLKDAKNNVVQNLAFELGTENGVKISSETISKIQEKMINQLASFNSDYQEIIKIEQEGFNISFSKVDEYFELVEDSNKNKYYRVWHLYSVGSNSNFTPRISYTTKYGWEAGFRSLLVPGWGQFYKKNKKKGYLFISAAVASTGSFLYTQNEYNYNINRLQEATSLEIQQEYSSRADEFKSYKNISLGAMAAVWIWSVVDAVSNDGAPKYADNNFDLRLNSDKNQSIALSIKYKF